MMNEMVFAITCTYPVSQLYCMPLCFYLVKIIKVRKQRELDINNQYVEFQCKMCNY